MQKQALYKGVVETAEAAAVPNFTACKPYQIGPQAFTQSLNHDQRLESSIWRISTYIYYEF